MKRSRYRAFISIVFVSLYCQGSFASEIDRDCKKACEAEQKECRNITDKEIDSVENPILDLSKPEPKHSNWPEERQEKLSESNNFKNHKAKMHAQCFSKYMQCVKKCTSQSAPLQ